MAWWQWAWKQPQAAGWSVDAGMEAVIARRAALEDDLAMLDADVDLIGVIPRNAAGGVDDDQLEKFLRVVEAMVARLRAIAGGNLGIIREMHALDRAIGMTPKGLADLRWVIIDPAAEETAKKPAAKKRDATVHRLRAVDSVAVAGS